MNYEKLLNINCMQLKHLRETNVDVEMLALDGFKYEPELTATLDEQIELFSENHICHDRDW